MGTVKVEDTTKGMTMQYWKLAFTALASLQAVVGSKVAMLRPC